MASTFDPVMSACSLVMTTWFSSASFNGAAPAGLAPITTVDAATTAGDELAEGAPLEGGAPGGSVAAMVGEWDWPANADRGP